jgi:hypothetical protein
LLQHRTRDNVDAMHVRRFVAALAAIALALALGFPPGPAQARASMGDMPCHSDSMPMTGDEAPAQPSCCLPMCWVAVELSSPQPLTLGPNVFAELVKVAFASVSVRPRLPPPRV